MFTKGHEVTIEIRQKLSEAAKGKIPSIETRRKVSEALKGRPKSAQTRERMLQYQRNRNPDHNRHISEGLRGKKLTPEHIENQRITKKATGSWKPIGYTFERRGYRWIKIAENQGRKNYASEHRYVIEQTLGRSLLPCEHVHHLDGNSLNNDPSNLALVSKTEHALLSKLLIILNEDMAKTVVDTLIKRFPNLD